MSCKIRSWVQIITNKHGEKKRVHAIARVNKWELYIQRELKANEEKRREASKGEEWMNEEGFRVC